MTVFSFGAGQDSSCFLDKLLEDQSFFDRHIKGELIVVGSDTGEEHPHSYAVVAYFKNLCKEKGVKFFWVTPEMGFHPNTWQSLKYQYSKNCSIGSASFQQTCTDNLKVKVVNNFVEDYLQKKYQFFKGRKQVYYHHTEKTGESIRLILGFAKGEEHRVKNGNRFDPKWKKDTMERYYPLMVDGMGRQDCINYNEANIPIKIFPSNCMICFYQSDQEILWLERFYPKVFNEWVQLEANKLAKYSTKEKNYGVYGKITLTEKLDKAKKLYGHWTDEELNEYKYSHGHCIKSKY